MSFPLISSSQLPGIDAYQIPASLRLRSSVGAYASFTPTVTGNRKTWLFNAWVKRGTLSVVSDLFSAGVAGGPYNYVRLGFTADDSLEFIAYDDVGAQQWYFKTAAKFRDPSGHMHIQCAVDTTQAISTDRVKIYINGILLTAFITGSFSTTYPAQNIDSWLGTSGYPINIGRFVNGTNYFDGYISDVCFIDGSTPAVTQFGNFDSDGNWKAKQYTGSYGTNGFYLNFSDVTTITTLVANKVAPSPKYNMSVTGDTKWLSTQYKFADKSIYFDGTGDLLAHPSSAVLSPGTSDFTIEGWVFPVTLSGTSKVFLAGQSDWATQAGSSFITYIGSGGQSSDIYGSGITSSISSPNPPVGQWSHVAWVKSGNNWSSYLNGVRVGTASNFSGSVNVGSNTYAASIGNASNGTNSAAFNGYIAEVQMLIGKAKYSGATYTVPSAELITDGSGWPYIAMGVYGSRGSLASPTVFPNAVKQEFTPNNISLAAGIAYDAMKDVPLGGGGNELGNYATFICLVAPNTNPGTLSEGNLKLTSPFNAVGYGYVTQQITGKTYCEFHPNNIFNDTSNYFGVQSGNTVSFYSSSGNRWNGTSWVSYGTAYASPNICGMAVDINMGTVEFFVNGVSQGIIGGLTVGPMSIFTTSYISGGNAYWFANFGQRPFAYTPPAGFKPLHTGNLAEPLIANPEKNFDVITYTGNGADNRTLTNANFDPDLIWFKSRSGAYNNALNDRVRGNDKPLFSNLTNGETPYTGYMTFGGLGTNQFNISYNGSGGVTNEYNTSAATYVAWLWKAGGASVTNTNGTITSQVSANPAAGFSIVTYTGNGANSTVGHGLGVAPKMIIIKNRGAIGTAEWLVGHGAIGFGDFLLLNSTGARVTASNRFNNTAPTSSVFSVGTIPSSNTETYVAYCFAEISGYSKIGSYTGNGSADGPFVYCGFRPKWILIKQSTGVASHWYMFDTTRDLNNPEKSQLVPNLSNAEGVGADILDITSNGFKIRNNSAGAFNGSGDTYIFMTIAEAPFKYALAR